jgi:ATP-dependent Zn protease
MTGGVTWMEQGDNFYLSKKEAYAQVAVAMGGRVGEEILMGGEYTQGASSDLKKATEVAFAITNNYGMSSLGLTYRDSNSQSDPLVNSEIDNILNKGYAQAKKILTSNSALAEALALELLKNEEVSFLDIQLIEKRLKKRNRHI